MAQLFVFDFDQLQRLLGDLRRIGQHRGDRIADIAHLVDGDDRLILVGRAILEVEALDVIARQGRDNAGQLFGFRGIDLDQSRVRHRAAQYPRMGHARQLDIAGIDRLAADFFDGVDPVRIGADDV